MYELKVALKYLIPQRKSLSTALVSLLSISVISLVVWLVLIFLSVTSGIEENWLKKLTSLHAPLRISPTKAYYDSYSYQIDAFAEKTGYKFRSIGEKALARSEDSYSPLTDVELPSAFPKKEDPDPVRKAFSLLEELGYPFQDYEISSALLRLQLKGAATLSQMSYLLSKPDKNPHFLSLLIERADFPPGEEEPIFLPKSLKDADVSIGTKGFLSYQGISALSSQEQKIPVIVSGFYDPGLISSGGKCLIVSKEVIRSIRNSMQTFSPDGTPTNGIFIWLDEIQKAPLVQQKIEELFLQAGIDKYWKVENFREFSFSKDFLEQFQSDRTLFLLIAVIILIVACSNIISLLTLLVNDKKKEIAILRALGASFKSIACIFAVCGVFLGILGALIGTFLATFTLAHLDTFVVFLSSLQGHQAFNPAFFGKTLPNQLSKDALLFVLILTPLLSLLAGLIPALKAQKVHPSTCLKGE